MWISLCSHAENDQIYSLDKQDTNTIKREECYQRAARGKHMICWKPDLKIADSQPGQHLILQHCISFPWSSSTGSEALSYCLLTSKHTSPSFISKGTFQSCFNDDSRSRINLQFKWPYKVQTSGALLIGMNNLHDKKGQIESFYRLFPEAKEADCWLRRAKQ